MPWSSRQDCLRQKRGPGAREEVGPHPGSAGSAGGWDSGCRLLSGGGLFSFGLPLVFAKYGRGTGPNRGKKEKKERRKEKKNSWGESVKERKIGLSNSTDPQPRFLAWSATAQWIFVYPLPLFGARLRQEIWIVRGLFLDTTIPVRSKAGGREAAEQIQDLAAQLRCPRLVSFLFYILYSAHYLSI